MRLESQCRVLSGPTYYFEEILCSLALLVLFFKMTFYPCLKLAANSIQGEREARQGKIIWTASFSNKEIQIVLRENLTGVALVMHQRFNHSTGHKRCLIFQGYAWFNYSPLLSTSPLKRHQRKPELH